MSCLSIHYVLQSLASHTHFSFPSNYVHFLAELLAHERYPLEQWLVVVLIASTPKGNVYLSIFLTFTQPEAMLLSGAASYESLVKLNQKHVDRNQKDNSLKTWVSFN